MAVISTKLYAPQARLVNLRSGKIVGATAIAGESGDVVKAIAPDIVSAKVTLTNTGIGQLNVTLNNQRFDQAMMEGGGPAHPPWKYNDFSKGRADTGDTGIGGITFGQKLRLDMRYGDGVWTKMIIAQVTDLQFSFPASGGAQVQVVGEDLLSLLKIKPTEDKNHDKQSEEDVVKKIFGEIYKNDPPGIITDPGAAAAQGRTTPQRSVKHTKGNTYFQFFQEMADRLDYEMFMEFKKKDTDEDAAADAAAAGEIKVADEQDFHFVPARSGLPPVETEMDGLDQEEGLFHYVLRWGRSLIEFTPKFKVFDMPTKAEAMGTDQGKRAKQKEVLSEGELTDALKKELPKTPNYDLDMVDALTARKEYFGDSSAGGNESQQGSNLDGPRLKLKAKAGFLKKVREFLTADGKVIGLPKLRPGEYVDIVGLRPPFDGYYYITKTVHSLDSSGCITQFSLRRPGMLPPEQYLAVSQVEQEEAPTP
jgi:hypothetical protein